MHTSMGTDTEGFGRLAQYFLLGKPRSAESVPSVLTKLKLDLPSPRQLANVSMDTILTFRANYATERMRFRKAVEDLQRTVSELDDVNAIRDLLAEKSAEIRDAISTYKRILNSYRITSFVRSLSLTAPMLITSLAGLGHMNATLGISSGLLLVFSAAWAEYDRSRITAGQSCPWVYILRAQKKFGASSSQV